MELPGASFFLGGSAANLKLLSRSSLLGWSGPTQNWAFLSTRLLVHLEPKTLPFKNLHTVPQYFCSSYKPLISFY
ncbi:hypothetical protein N665_0025s0217 [Sinapis alba]|nr:hypothetical protein N665_0025s0217 [Sinapis alba]